MEASCWLISGVEGFPAMWNDECQMPFCTFTSRWTTIFLQLLYITNILFNVFHCLSCRWVQWASEQNGYLGTALRKGLNSYLKGNWC